MSSQHQCSFVSKLSWRRPGVSSHPSVHLLSLCQNSTSAASNMTVGWLMGINGVHAGEDFRLTEGEVVIGSGWDSDIVLTSPEVSRTHAKVTATAGSCVLDDLGSATGVFVNGAACVESTRLKHLDHLKMGMGEFIYVDMDTSESDKQDQQMKSILNALRSSSGRRPTLGWLVCMSGDLRGLDFRLLEGVNKVGSSHGLEVTIPDPNMGSVHFRIECALERYYVRSESADFQLLREGLLVGPGLLKNNDVIQLGTLMLRFRSMT